MSRQSVYQCDLCSHSCSGTDFLSFEGMLIGGNGLIVPVEIAEEGNIHICGRCVKAIEIANRHTYGTACKVGV